MTRHACRQCRAIQAAHKRINGRFAQSVHVENVRNPGRFDAVGNQVVGNHCHKIEAERVVPAAPFRYLDFGSDSIRGDSDTHISELKQVRKRTRLRQNDLPLQFAPNRERALCPVESQAGTAVSKIEILPEMGSHFHDFSKGGGTRPLSPCKGNSRASLTAIGPPATSCLLL